MGTRADFYIGIGKDAEWLGSIAWDGGEIPDEIWMAPDEDGFRHQVALFLSARDDATLPAQGWPWPWNDSGTTDCSYWFGNGIVYGEARDWLLPRVEYLRYYSDDDAAEPSKTPGAIRADFPDMSARKNVRFDKGSGLMIVGVKS